MHRLVDGRDTIGPAAMELHKFVTQFCRAPTLGRFVPVAGRTSSKACNCIDFEQYPHSAFSRNNT
jgi:hypothetical protein